MVIHRERIRLPVQARDKEVQVNFIVVEACSPYTTILAGCWLLAIGAMSSTLHLKDKYPTQGCVGEIVGSQATTRQYLIATVRQYSVGETRVGEAQVL